VPQIATARPVTFNRGDAATPDRRERYREQTHPGVQVEHGSVQRHRVDHRLDQRGQQKAIGLKERFDVALKRPGVRGPASQDGERVGHDRHAGRSADPFRTKAGQPGQAAGTQRPIERVVVRTGVAGDRHIGRALIGGDILGELDGRE
jgi:hypothetical protein